ncbi:MAG: hypothetical protein IT211_13235 [Armatimonadetes bacterium]|nr:hypothetical protein [Armatimonadota bacterium]
MPVFLTLLVLLAVAALPTAAATRVSQEDGPWEQIEWSPAGRPEPGDSVLILSRVTDIPNLHLAAIEIRSNGRLVVNTTGGSVAHLLNNGAVELAIGALTVTESATNNGVMSGSGLLRLAGISVRLGGTAPVGNVVVAGPAGNSAVLTNHLSVGTLTLSTSTTLSLHSYQLTVAGTYSSQSPFGQPGIVAESGGSVRFGGEINGSVEGNIVIEEARQTSNLRGRVVATTVAGLIGRSTDTVQFAGLRHVGVATFRGTVIVNSAAIVKAVGLGTSESSGAVAVEGTVVVYGQLCGESGKKTWRVEGNVLNHGIITDCVMEIIGQDRTLRTDSGVWNPTTSLRYRGSSHARLRVVGSITTPFIEVLPIAPSDSDIAVKVTAGEAVIRHRFTSNIQRGCRLESDSVVRVRGVVDGDIHANITLDGFWGARLSGRLGGNEKQVTVMLPKQADAGLKMIGSVRVAKQANLAIGKAVTIEGNLQVEGRLALDSARVQVAGSLGCSGIITGSGTLQLTPATGTLSVSGSIKNSVAIQLGTDSSASMMTGVAPLRIATLHILPESSIALPTTGEVELGNLQYDVRYPAGSNIVSAAVQRSLFAPPIFSPPIFLFAFDGADYFTPTTLRSGEGYLASFPTDTVIMHNGSAITLPLTIPIHNGWNLISGPSFLVDISTIEITGATRSSDFYSRPNLTQPTTILQPGRGYWVKFSGTGTMIIAGRE